MSKNSKQRNDLETARKRHAALHGPSIEFKRSRRQQGTDCTGDGSEDAKAGESNPYGRCPNVSSRYEKLNRIGEGTYGVVYRARDKVTGNIVALKRCLPHHEASDGFPLTTLREINILRELGAHRHPGVVHLIDVAVSSSRSGVFLVFEYCEHDLASLVDHHHAEHGTSPFRESEAKRLFIQLLSALSFLHSRYVLHRDIKLSNLLYHHRGELRLADFGLSRRIGCTRGFGRDGYAKSDTLEVSVLTPKVVSLWYRPPELLLGSEEYDEGVDNWGAGCVIAELLKGVPLIKGRTEMEQITKMFELFGPPCSSQWPGLYNMPLVKDGSIEIPRRMHVLQSPSVGRGLHSIFTSLSPAGLTLMSSLLKYDPSKRWSADDALASEYFKELPAPTNCSLMPTFPTKHGA